MNSKRIVLNMNGESTELEVGPLNDVFFDEGPENMVLFNEFLKQYRTRDLPDDVTITGLCVPRTGGDHDWVQVSTRYNRYSMGVSIVVDLSSWFYDNTEESFNVYLEEATGCHDYKLDHTTHEQEGFTACSFSISLDISDSCTLIEKYETLMSAVHKSYVEALELINKRNNKHDVLRIFNFPPEYKNICSQYLIWFGEFLEKFGINALISINHEGDDTQVVVSSAHTEQLFTEIEALFSQYIALPYAEYLPAPSQTLSPEQQFMVTQLQTQVNHFKGQLEMKSAAIQLKEATLQSLQHTIQTQQNTIDVQKNQLFLIESMQSDDEVELFGGIIRLGTIEWGPIKVSPKRLLQR
ncbi:hypothetical protein AB6C73_12275 [Vibrio splendidus]